MTDYLAKVSPEFKSKVGVGTQVNFPAGVGGRGSSGVSAVLSRTNGGITYVDVAFATKSHFSFFSVKNKAGKYQLPGSQQIKAAMDDGEEDHAGQQDLDRRSGEDARRRAYPISTFTYIILPTKSDNAAALRKFVFWGMTNGVKKYGAGAPVRAGAAEGAERLGEDAQEGPELTRLFRAGPGTWSRDLSV